MRTLAQFLKSVSTVIAIAVALSLLSGCADRARRYSIKDEAAPRTKYKWKASRKTAKLRQGSLAVRARAEAAPVPVLKQSTCVSDEICLARLKALVTDKSRAWVGQPQAPVDHLTGTRQFAYRALRSKLTCPELARAIKEMEAVPVSISAPGVAAEHVARVRMLDGQVTTELRAERNGRCPNT